MKGTSIVSGIGADLTGPYANLDNAYTLSKPMSQFEQRVDHQTALDQKKLQSTKDILRQRLSKTSECAPLIGRDSDEDYNLEVDLRPFSSDIDGPTLQRNVTDKRLVQLKDEADTELDIRSYLERRKQEVRSPRNQQPTYTSPTYTSPTYAPPRPPTPYPQPATIPTIVPIVQPTIIMKESNAMSVYKYVVLFIFIFAAAAFFYCMFVDDKPTAANDISTLEMDSILKNMSK